MNYYPKVLLSWETCAPSCEELRLIEDKIQAIVNNIEDIHDYSEPPRKGTISPSQLLEIHVDMDEDPETFDIHVCPTSNGEFPYHSACCDGKATAGSYEIVTEAAARFNDRDFNQGRPELGDNFDYVLSEVNSDYVALGNSGYYYRYL